MKKLQGSKFRLDARAKVLKAMAHPTRLFILEELAQGERCVGELTAMTDLDMSTISKHLSVLQNTGLIDGEKRGMQIFYSLRTPCIMKFMTCVETVLQSNIKVHLASVK